MTLSRRPHHNPPSDMRRSMLDRLIADGFLGPTFEALLADSAPALNVRETGDAYVVEVGLPGIDPVQIDVTVEGRTLTIRGRYDGASALTPAGGT